MSKKLSITLLLLPVLFTGCVGTGPNTQRGAVGGAALGGLAGAIIGNNSRGHNTWQGAAIGAALGGLAGGVLGNARDNEDNTTYRPAPPPPVVYVTPAPVYYAEGHYIYDNQNRSWIWVPNR